MSVDTGSFVPIDLDVDLSQHLDDLMLDETDDEDEPVLRWKDGRLVDTWREGYPYDERMPRADYEVVKRLLQIELLRLQNWVKDNGKRIVILFEGRDAAGKGGHHQAVHGAPEPRGSAVVALEKPNEREQNEWYFQRYVEHLPSAGEIVLFDRSWYNRAGVERVMGYCTDEQYQRFVRQAPEFERMLTDEGIAVIKLWFSVSRSEQRTRFLIRQIDPVRQWKLSPTDMASLDRWDDYTAAKEAMFQLTDTTWAPWTVIKSNDKKRARDRGHALRAWPVRLHQPGPRDRRETGSPHRRPRLRGLRARRDAGRARECCFLFQPRHANRALSRLLVTIERPRVPNRAALSRWT